MAGATEAPALAAIAPAVTISTDRGSLTITPSGPPLCAIPGPPEVFAPDPPPTVFPPCATYVPGGSGRQLDYSAGSQVQVSASEDIQPPLVALFDQSRAVVRGVQSVATGPRTFTFEPLPGAGTAASFSFPYDDGRWTGTQLYDVGLTEISAPAAPAPAPPIAKPATQLVLRAATRGARGVRLVIGASQAGRVKLQWTAAGRSARRTVTVKPGRRTISLPIARRATRVRVRASLGQTSAVRSFILR